MVLQAESACKTSFYMQSPSMRPWPLIGPPGIPGMPWRSPPVSPGLTGGVRQVTPIPTFHGLFRLKPLPKMLAPFIVYAILFQVNGKRGDSNLYHLVYCTIWSTTPFGLLYHMVECIEHALLYHLIYYTIGSTP